MMQSWSMRFLILLVLIFSSSCSYFQKPPRQDDLREFPQYISGLEVNKLRRGRSLEEIFSRDAELRKEEKIIIDALKKEFLDADINLETEEGIQTVREQIKKVRSRDTVASEIRKPFQGIEGIVTASFFSILDGDRVDITGKIRDYVYLDQEAGLFSSLR